MALKVIGAGFGRTGTESMKTALELIGFGPCYHMHEVLPDQSKVDTWRGIANGDSGDWDKIFTGYQATVDWPGAFVWRDLAAHFPDAKILLTNRDAESWYRSMDNTILEVMRNSTDPDSIGSNMLKKQVFGDKIADRDHVIGIFEKNVADVQAAFGPDRLLTFNIGDGWEPLCGFLDCPVPDQPFPHSNRPGAFHNTLQSAEDARGTGET
jgi:hypothetical protein